MTPYPQLHVSVVPGSGNYAEKHVGHLEDGTKFTGKSCEFDACRYLLAKGAIGKLHVLGPDGRHRMTIDIAKGATLAVSEGDRSGPKFVKFKPFTRRPPA